MDCITYNPGDILRETMSEIYNILGDAMDTIAVERCVIGLFFTGVKLSNGAGGLCFTPIKAIPEAVCCPSSARVMPASGKLRNRPAAQFIDEIFSGNPLKKTMGIAVVNALSIICWKERPHEAYEIITGVDALDEMAVPDDAQVVVVGGLVPALRTLKQRGKPFTILELDPSVLKSDEMQYYVPYQQARERVPYADLLIITGTTIINDSLEYLLGMMKPGAGAIVVGPTASMLPAAFFKRGVTVMGGIIITDADKVLDVISEAGSGYHFFRKGAERVVIQPVHKTEEEVKQC